MDEAKQAVASRIALPRGLLAAVGRAIREPTGDAAARLGLVVPVALGLIFVVLFMTFGSARQALLILCNVPFALVGGVLALWMSGQYLSVPASVGFIALLGVAVLNGLVLVTQFNQLHAQGLPMQGGARGRMAARAPGDDDGQHYRTGPWCRCCSHRGQARKSNAPWRSWWSVDWYRPRRSRCC